MSHRGRSIALATIYGQFALVLVFPVLTRIYSTEAFAGYQLAFSVAVVLQSALAGGVEFIIPVTTSSWRVRQLVRRGLATGILLTTAGATLAVVVWLGGRSDIAEAILAGLLIAATTSFATVDNAQLTRLSNSHALIWRNLWSGTLCVVFQIAGGLLTDSFWVLVIAVAAARLLSVAIVRRPSTGPIELRLNEVTPGTADRSPLSGSQSALWILGVAASNAAVQAPVFVIAVLANATEAAQFAIAIRIVSLMTTVLGAGISATFLFKVSSLIRDGSSEALSHIKRTQIQMTWLGIAAGAGVAVTSWWVVPFLLGPSWTTAGTLGSILAVPYGLQLANRILTPLHTIMASNRLNLTLQAVRLFGVVAVLWAGATVGLGDITLGCLLGFAMAVFSIIYVVFTLGRAANHFAARTA